MKQLLRKSMLFSLVLMYILLSLPIIPISFAQSYEEIAFDEFAQPYAADQLIIGYKVNTPAETRRNIRAQNQMEVKSELNSINGEVVKVAGNRSSQALEALRRNPNIEFVEYDYIMNISLVPNDPNYPSQVYLPYMNTPAAWDITTGNRDVLVAVLDTGLNTTNRDLANMDVRGYNVIANSSNYLDDHGHGTMVTSVIAAEMNNAFGFAGIAPNVSFLSVKVMSSSGTGTYSDMIKGIDYAVNQGAKVINMSIGGRTASSALQLAVKNAVDRGVTIVAAAGNEGSTTVSFPAAYPEVIGVGAVDIYGSKMTFSNTGSGLTIMAGGSARVATFSDFISTASGTSFSSPYVAGLVALMYSVNPSITPALVMDSIAQTAKDLGASGYDTTFGHGVVDMGKALALVAGKPVTAPAVDTTPPVLTLIGDAMMTHYIGETFTDPGAIAFDNVDGEITNQIVVEGHVNSNFQGVYSLSYSVKDKAGNLSNIEKRTVEVIPLPTQEETTEAIIDLGPETKLVRDVAVIQGSLSKKTPTMSHVISITTPGKLDVALSYSGRTAPSASITGLNFNGVSGSFDVTEGSYVLTLNSSANSNISYNVNITYPEREVPINVPLGDAEVIIYDETSYFLWYVYLAVSLLLFIAMAVMIKMGRMKYVKK
ncbi:MAG TPA: hypothetical protein DCS67_05645 [Clostridiales bacterium UBA8960]|jgi:hypothetical protein|nr:hypothetical protein [Clostridiales bacterium UBA8960]